MVIASVNHVSGSEHAQVLTSTAAGHSNSNNNNNGSTVAATTTTAGAVIGVGGGGAGPSAIEHFNLTTIGELSNVQLSNINAQLVGGTVTADGSLVTMGGIVVGRLHHTAISNHQHSSSNAQPQLHRSTQQTQTSQADLQQHQPQQQQPQQGGVIKIETQGEFMSEG